MSDAQYVNLINGLKKQAELIKILSSLLFQLQPVLDGVQSVLLEKQNTQENETSQRTGYEAIIIANDNFQGHQQDERGTDR